MASLFLALPGEIRNLIYFHLLTENLYTIGYKYSGALNDTDFYQSTPSVDLEDPRDLDDELYLSAYQPHPICHVSTQLRNEATSIFWKRARFTLHPCLPPFNINYPLALCARIQTLEIDLTRLINSIEIHHPSIHHVRNPHSLKHITLTQFPNLSHLTVTWNCPIGFHPSYWLPLDDDDDPTNVYGWHYQLFQLLYLMHYRKRFTLALRLNLYSKTTTTPKFIVANYELPDVPLTAFWSTSDPTLRFKYRAGEARKKHWEDQLIAALHFDTAQVQLDAEIMVREAVQMGGLKLMQVDELLEIVDERRIELVNLAWEKFWFPRAFYVHGEKGLNLWNTFSYAGF